MKVGISPGIEYIHEDVKFVSMAMAYTRDEDGTLIRRAEKFGIVIEKGVFLGSGVRVVRGRWRDTEIREGTKIGNMVNIGHNVIIGKHVAVYPNVTICGSVNIGDYSEIGAGSVIKEHINIGQHCVVGGMRYVNKHMEDETRF